jgi:hypothetical protein
MQPHPSIKELNLNAQQPYGPPPFDIDSVMATALKLSMTFNISLPGSMRVVPSTLYLGHDSDYLYVGGKFQGIGMNPVSTANQTLPDSLSMFFDVADSGVLRQPESGFRFSAYITQKWSGLWIYHDELWDDYVQEYGRASWIPADDYYTYDLGKPQTVFSDGDGIKEYDNSTGTLTILLSRHLSCPGNSEVNAFQMKPGERWVIGFLTEIGYITDISQFGDFVDGWPKNIYPYLSNDSSWWPKLVIDLTNPPPIIPGLNTTNDSSICVHLPSGCSYGLVNFRAYSLGAGTFNPLLDPHKETGGLELHVWDMSGKG